ncbi:MAG: hypothetical protein JXB49_14960 [Bacteroidales bacterium]|nr:hypothetical protein [Bacteroidales bacterium]
MEPTDNYKQIINRFGFYSSIALTVITLITFGFAMTAVPISGAFCPGNCIDYPYLDTLNQYPKDFLWMYFAILLTIIYIGFMVSIHSYTSNEKKIFSQTGLTFSIISTVILAGAYFIQSSVIPASLMNGETEGVTMLIQYNPHGVFVVLEEIGYIMMSISFLFIAFAFTNKSRIEKSIRWIFISAFILTVISFTIITIQHGIVRKDRFEVAVISIDWLVLIVNGILISKVFNRALKQELK